MNIQIGGEAKRNLLVVLGALCGLLISVILLFSILTKDKKEVKEGKKLILPAGSVVRVKTLNGIVFPLFGQKEKESYPVLFRVLSATCRDKKIGLEGEFCSILGEARITDFSTERIGIITIRIKCSDNDRITRSGNGCGYNTKRSDRCSGCS